MGDAEGDHRPCPIHHQDQDHCSPREEVLRLDRWLHLGLPLHFPTDVDHQARVRRVRSFHCPQEVLLNPIANLEIFVQFSLEKKYMGRFTKKKKGGPSKKKKKKKKKS